MYFHVCVCVCECCSFWHCSCLALHDLLVVYQSYRVCGYLASLWELSFRARDDIKVYLNTTCIHASGVKERKRVIKIHTCTRIGY